MYFKQLTFIHLPDVVGRGGLRITLHYLSTWPRPLLLNIFSALNKYVSLFHILRIKGTISVKYILSWIGQVVESYQQLMLDCFQITFCSVECQDGFSVVVQRHHSGSLCSVWLIAACVCRHGCHHLQAFDISDNGWPSSMHLAQKYGNCNPLCRTSHSGWRIPDKANYQFQLYFIVFYCLSLKKIRYYSRIILRSRRCTEAIRCRTQHKTMPRRNSRTQG